MKKTSLKTFSAAMFLAAAVLLLVCPDCGGVSEKGDAEPATTNDAVKVDLDFTRMNTTLMATYTYRLAANPKEFEGKTLRLGGTFLTGVDEDDGKRHFGCLVGDVGGCSCCAQGLVMEFVPKDSYAWPTNFPPFESRVTITGRLKMFKVGDTEKREPQCDMPLLVDADILSP